MLFKIVLLAFVVVSAATAPSTPKHQMVARTDGGYGGSSGYGYKQQSSFQETESYKMIKKKYEHLSSSIDDCHHALTSKTVSEQVAIEQVKKVAYSFKSAFGGHLGCGACSYHMRAYKSDIQSSFRKFSSLVSTVQQLFPDKWDSILHAGLYEAASTFRSFFERVQSKGFVSQFLDDGDNVSYSSKEWSTTFEKIGFKKTSHFIAIHAF